MNYKLDERDIEIINAEIGYKLSFHDYDIRKSSCFAEIQENLENGVTSFEVEDDLTGQNEEEILHCIEIVYNRCIIRSERALRIKMQFDLEETRLNVRAKLIDVADHREDPSYLTRLVIENEIWTIEDLKRWIAEDLEDEEEIELALEEELDEYNETDDALRHGYEAKFSISTEI